MAGAQKRGVLSHLGEFELDEAGMPLMDGLFEGGLERFRVEFLDCVRAWGVAAVVGAVASDEHDPAADGEQFRRGGGQLIAEYEENLVPFRCRAAHEVVHANGTTMG